MYSYSPFLVKLRNQNALNTSKLMGRRDITLFGRYILGEEAEYLYIICIQYLKMLRILCISKTVLIGVKQTYILFYLVKVK